MVQVPSGGKWIKAAEISLGDRVKIITEADWEESTYNGEPVNQFVCNVEYRGEQRKLKLTMASCNEIAPVYGKDSKEWIGKELLLESIKVAVGGKMKHSILATPISAQVPQAEGPVWE